MVALGVVVVSGSLKLGIVTKEHLVGIQIIMISIHSLGAELLHEVRNVRLHSHEGAGWITLPIGVLRSAIVLGTGRTQGGVVEVVEKHVYGMIGMEGYYTVVEMMDPNRYMRMLFWEGILCERNK